MKVKMLLVAAAILVFAAAGFSQPMQYSANNAPGDPYFGVQLTTTCGGTVGIPDGEGMVWIYQDADGNGPSSNDLPLTLCTHPENDCVGGPNGTFNLNHFPINGMEQVGEAGYFVATNYAVSYGTMPSGQPRFFCRVFYPINNPTVMWTSNVLTAPATGGIGDWFFSAWICSTLVTPCTPSPDYTFAPIAPDGADPVACDIQLCPDHVFTVCVGPVPLRDRVPYITVTACPGSTLPAGLVTSWNGFTGWTWTVKPEGNFYCGTITTPTAVCICLNYEHMLPVTMGNFAANGLDNSVKVAWNTLSETSIARFDIYRDGARVASKEATNNATGANYEYVDNTAVNGTTYAYELKAVGLDGTVSSLATSNATPSFDAALVTEYALHQNFPNPFNPSTRIAFDLKEANTVTLTVYNATGQEVATLLNNVSYSKAGRYSYEFDASKLTSGLYFYTVKIGNEFSATKKMLLVK